MHGILRYQGYSVVQELFMTRGLNKLRINVNKNQRNRGHGQKIDFAHTLSA